MPSDLSILDKEHIFDLSPLTGTQRHYFEKVVFSYDYDWVQMTSKLEERSAYYGSTRSKIPVTVKDISEYGAAGLSWTDGRLEIDDQVAPDAWPPGWTHDAGWLWFMQVAIHEIAHQVHFFGVTPEMETRIAELCNWESFNGCTFSNPFARAFSKYKVGRSTETDIGRKRIKQIRALLGGTGDPPTKRVMTA